MINEILTFLDNNHILYETNVDLKKKTWIHRGGIAKVFISPMNEQELCNVVSYLYRYNVKFLLIGHTSNMYILNTTNISVVVSTAKCCSYSLVNNKLYCEAGVSVIKLSMQLIKQGIKGFEYLTGLPGTIGAALVNNSSCKEHSISDLLIRAKILLKDGKIEYWGPSDFKFQFRSSILKRKEIEGCILSIILNIEKDSAEHLIKIAEENRIDRERRLDGYARNLGCIFDEPFCLGPMKFKYKLVELFFRTIGKIFGISTLKINSVILNILSKISHCEGFLPYVSHKNFIIFMWRDNGADAAFPIYCKFIKEVYRTDKLEIEIIK